MPKCEMCGAEYLEGEKHACETKSESVVETQESTTESQEKKTE